MRKKPYTEFAANLLDITKDGGKLLTEDGKWLYETPAEILRLILKDGLLSAEDNLLVEFERYLAYCPDCLITGRIFIAKEIVRFTYSCPESICKIFNSYKLKSRYNQLKNCIELLTEIFYSVFANIFHWNQLASPSYYYIHTADEITFNFSLHGRPDTAFSISNLLDGIELDPSFERDDFIFYLINAGFLTHGLELRVVYSVLKKEIDKFASGYSPNNCPYCEKLFLAKGKRLYDSNSCKNMHNLKCLQYVGREVILDDKISGKVEDVKQNYTLIKVRDKILKARLQSQKSDTALPLITEVVGLKRGRK